LIALVVLFAANRREFLRVQVKSDREGAIRSKHCSVTGFNGVGHAGGRNTENHRAEIASSARRSCSTQRGRTRQEPPTPVRLYGSGGAGVKAFLVRGCNLNLAFGFRQGDGVGRS